MGTHLLAGLYNGKADCLKHAFECLVRIPKGDSVILNVDHVYILGDTTIVEMTSTALIGRCMLKESV